MESFIKNRRKELGLTMKQVADIVGVSEATVSRWESGNIANMRRDRIALLSKALNCSPAYIMGWEDEDFDIYKYDNIRPMPKMKKVPRLGTIACGEPILANEEHGDFDSLPVEIKCDFTLVCKGDSMINARIFDGDVVAIKAQPTVENGEIAAVIIDNEATLKRVYLQNDMLILQPENNAYKPLIYQGEQLNQIKILGKAVYFISNVR